MIHLKWHVRAYAKEDDVDFPKLIKYEQGEVVDDINTVIDDLVSDHIATGQLLVKMSDLTSSYEPPIVHVVRGDSFIRD